MSEVHLAVLAGLTCALTLLVVASVCGGFLLGYKLVRRGLAARLHLRAWVLVMRARQRLLPRRVADGWQWVGAPGPLCVGRWEHKQLGHIDWNATDYHWSGRFCYDSPRDSWGRTNTLPGAISAIKDYDRQCEELAKNRRRRRHRT